MNAHWMTRYVDIARRDESAWQAAVRMHQRGVGTLVVVDESRQPVGILTDRDLVERVMAKCLDPSLTPIEEIMTTPVVTAKQDAPIEEMISRMRRGVFRRLPLIDQDGKLAGLVSLDDLLIGWSRQIAEVGALLEQETPQSLLARPPVESTEAELAET